MSEATSNLSLPYILASQAQKHITHNEALKMLDALIHLALISDDISVPPDNPGEGECYWISGQAQGEWSGHENQIAAFQDSTWAFYLPKQGTLAYVIQTKQIKVFDGTQWVEYNSGLDADNLGNGSLTQLGINTSADETNRLALSSPYSLFTHEGAGHQLKVNKKTTSDTASVLFQNNWSGRAEFGLTGNDDFHMKVSSDGSNWQEGIVIDKDTGATQFPNGMQHALTGAPVGQFLFTEQTDTAKTSIYRFNLARKQNPREAVLDAVSSNELTLTTTTANQFFTNSFMSGVSYVRIWNISKTPVASAWVSYMLADDKLQVTDEAHVSDWQAGETIQIGDPTSLTPSRVITLDISLMLDNVLGATFRQKGLFAKTGVIASTTHSFGLGVTPTGAGGSFMNLNADLSGTLHNGLVLIPCSEKSPISNSNVVKIREHDGGGEIGVALVSSMAVFG